MKMANARWLALVGLVALAACGSTLDSGTGDPGPPGETLDVERLEMRADRAAEWKARALAMTMWVESTLRPEFSRGELYWVMKGRVSKDLSGFRAYASDGAPFAARLASQRTFRVVLDTEDAIKVLAGERVYFDFFAPYGAHPMYHGTVRFAPRFGKWGGTSELFVLRAVNPVVVGDQVRFRGRATAKRGHELELVYTDDEQGPHLTAESDSRWRFEWSPRSLLFAADPVDDPVRFRLFDGAERRLEKTAQLELRLVQIGLTLEPPLVAWPREACSAEVRACLAELDNADTESCGYANQVDACVGKGATVPPGPTPERFLDDLREELMKWYEQMERDASEFEAPPLDEVLDRVDVENVRELDDLEAEEFFDWDPEHFQIYWYPDPVFAQSDRVWYGVYERSGALRSIYAVN